MAIIFFLVCFVYNGKDKTHALKYLAFAGPDGIILYLFGPIEGSRHDAHLLHLSDLVRLLQTQFAQFQLQRHCVFADLGFPQLEIIITPWVKWIAW
jgi:hypothetical protein